jgi:NAD+ kinase
MATVAILVHPSRVEAHDLAAGIAEWLSGQGHHARLLFLDGGDRAVEERVELPLSEVSFRDVDLAASFGGDGTFLRLAPIAAAADVPVIGVNFGRLGYLLELQPGQVREVLARALAGDVVVHDRSALTVTIQTHPRHTDSLEPVVVVDEEHPTRSWFALNEVVLEKTVFGHTVRLATAIDGEPFLTYSADGLIVATPTGSTAYNLSAGGPVLAPGLRAMVMTPVAPHLTIDRSLVLQPDQDLSVTIMDGPPAVLVVDGSECARLASGATLTCRVAPRPVRMVSLGERGFAEVLASTLARDARS